jgi:hypothetical protein
MSSSKFVTERSCSWVHRQQVNPLAQVSIRCSHLVTVFEDDMLPLFFISILILHCEMATAFFTPLYVLLMILTLCLFFSSATVRQTVMPWKANTSAAPMAIYTEMSARWRNRTVANMYTGKKTSTGMSALWRNRTVVNVSSGRKPLQKCLPDVETELWQTCLQERILYRNVCQMKKQNGGKHTYW